MDQAIDGDAPVGGSSKRPWHMWVVGIVSLAWNAFGANDYLQTVLHNQAYLAAEPPAVIAWVARFPTWEVALWALGVWGAVAGSLLLLARSRHAVTAFALSLAGLAGSSAYQWLVNPPPPEGRSGAMIAIVVVIWAVAVGLLWYARRMQARGELH
jgi:hypothetical protein